MKGGVGKTTLTVNLAACLARDYGKRVLVIDLDTQVNATLSLIPPLHFAKLKEEQRTLRTLINQILQQKKLSSPLVQQIIQNHLCQLPGLDLLPGDIDLYNDLWLAATVHSQARYEPSNFEKTWNLVEDNLIRGILQPVINSYDFILIDFSPGDNLITRSGIIASDFYLIPAKPEPLSVVGIGMLEGRIKQLQETNRSHIKLLGIVFTSLGHATTMAAKVKHRLEEEFGVQKIFPTEIPFNVDVARAVDDFRPVVINNTKALGAKAFVDLTAQLSQKINLITSN